jgi:transcription initiation factor IIE alpha subunit
VAVCAVNRLVCEDCGTVYYSAAAKTLAEQGETCAKCGGRLRFVDDGPGRVPVRDGGPVADGDDTD